MNRQNPSLAWLILAFFVGVCILAAPAYGQLHVTQSNGYVLRANVASAQNLPPAMIQKYKLQSADFLINVVVLKQGEPAPNTGIEAEVAVETTDLIGTRARIDMRTVEEHTGISYLGTFNAPLNELVLDFNIVARPAGSDALIGMRFRERLPRPR